MRKTILIIGTFDTKEDVVLFCRDRVKERGHDVLLMDIGILHDPTVSNNPSGHSDGQVGCAYQRSGFY
jgi:uncharacterized protein (UPF0261 family)